MMIECKYRRGLNTAVTGRRNNKVQQPKFITTREILPINSYLMLDEMQLMLIMSVAETCSRNYLITHRQPNYDDPILEPTLNEKSSQNYP